MFIFFLLFSLFAFEMRAFIPPIPPGTSLESLQNNTPQIDFSKIHGTDRERMLYFLTLFPDQQYEVVQSWSPVGMHRYFVDAYDCIKNDLRSGGPWEGHLTSYFPQYIKPGTTVIDVGAHIGTHTATMSKCVDTGRVIAFEPQPKIFRELVNNMALNGYNNIEFYWGAVGENNGIIELPPLNVSNEGATGIGYGDTGEYVQMFAIDSLHLDNVSFIKIDVEGNEHHVLAGAKKTILRNKPVMLVEIMGGSLPESATPEVRKEIARRIKMVEDMGYTMHRLANFWDYLALPL